ncbi:Hsp70 family protein [Rhodococcus sp. NPDC058521]|uniref:Hsp70 family protein n=1 Tax=Rhodococcus sp. NPDC058521 TaxID=3346536 RepID=UPI0036531865
MSPALGIKIGSVDFATTADPSDVDPDAKMTEIRHRSILAMTDGGAPVLKNAGSLPRGHGSGAEIVGFVSRVGDPVDLLTADGSAHRPEALVAAAIRYLVRYNAGTLPHEPTIAVAHPVHWDADAVGLVRHAMDRAELTHVALVSESEATLRALEATADVPDQGVVLVYDLGGNSLDVSVVRKGDHGIDTIGTPLHNLDFGGSQIDFLALQHILTGVEDEVGKIDDSEPAVREALTELRGRCCHAKEVLSAETAATVEVDLPGFHSDVRFTRPELEDLIRVPLMRTIELTRQYLHENDLGIDDVACVALAGGACSVPLVAEVISSEFRIPVVSVANPAMLSARGAALLSRSAATRSIRSSVPVTASSKRPSTVTTPRPHHRTESPTASAPTIESAQRPRRSKDGLASASPVPARRVPPAPVLSTPLVDSGLRGRVSHLWGRRAALALASTAVLVAGAAATVGAVVLGSGAQTTNPVNPVPSVMATEAVVSPPLEAAPVPGSPAADAPARLAPAPIRASEPRHPRPVLQPPETAARPVPPVRDRGAQSGNTHTDNASSRSDVSPQPPAQLPADVSEAPLVDVPIQSPADTPAAPPVYAPAQPPADEADEVADAPAEPEPEQSPGQSETIPPEGDSTTSSGGDETAPGADTSGADEQ